jgi:hypothetical protein
MWTIGLACGNNDGCLVGNIIAWPVIGAATLITGIVLLARGRTLPAADANRVEIIARGGKPLLSLTGGGFGKTPRGTSGGLQFAF